MAAIGAVDMALWDIRGKTLNAPGLRAARRRLARVGDGVRPRQRRHPRRDRGVASARTSRRASLRCGPSAACRASGTPTESRRDGKPVRAGRKGTAARNCLEHRALPRFRADGVRATAARVRVSTSPAARRPPSADADRSRAARTKPRAVSTVLDGGSDSGRGPGGVSHRSGSTRRRRSRSGRCSTRFTTATR